MKAIVYEKFGPPEVLKYKEIADPIPDEDEVLVKIHATAVAVEDPDMRESPGLNGLSKPKNPILGMYLAGNVQSTGSKIKRFNKGDRVFGSTMGYGTYAEYICLKEDETLVKIPENFSFEEAAAIPNGGLTSWPFLVDKANIQSGQKILINGASGAVGTSAVQVAKYFGAHVTGVCSTSNLELVKSLGADRVIDYTTEDFAKNDQHYDVIFDTVNKSSFGACQHILTESGKYLATGPSLEILWRIMVNPFVQGKKVIFIASALRSKQKKLDTMNSLCKMMREGKLKAVIDRTYPLEDMAEAHRYVQKGHKKGNVVIKIIKSELTQLTP